MWKGLRVRWHWADSSQKFASTPCFRDEDRSGGTEYGLFDISVSLVMGNSGGVKGTFMSEHRLQT